MALKSRVFDVKRSFYTLWRRAKIPEIARKRSFSSNISWNDGFWAITLKRDWKTAKISRKSPWSAHDRANIAVQLAKLQNTQRHVFAQREIFSVKCFTWNMKKSKKFGEVFHMKHFQGKKADAQSTKPPFYGQKVIFLKNRKELPRKAWKYPLFMVQ